ncbi:hypothetical protein M1L60_34840 [Actinoplanes sp. TRM 88003]|uniref:DUF4034 domain-containing protein n=1 Tax=Paractinoplanes aksuensis TaxID=2939490 RepID=A0ABT1E1R1_9ACTN|nr:hypothetical protein [Actinoplanes aksuensis]MCO8275771.1 hypothetical protein [Actinoplanes aksuensis]
MNGSDNVLLDPADAYPEIAAVRARLTAKDWTGVRAVVDNLSPSARTKIVRHGGSADGSEQVLREVLDRDPADGTAAAMLGHCLIDIGWKARSSYGAEHVSRDQFKEFHAWLRQAEAVLIDGAARNPRDPAIWAARLVSARGLELGLAEARRRYDRVKALDPHNLTAQFQMLQQLCPKWGGSWELLHPWARAEMLAAPPGAAQGVLVAEAHIEHWLELPAGTRTAYLNGASVRRELQEAADRSVLHPDFGRDNGWVEATSAFAFVFSLLNDRRSAARLFVLLGELATEYPWQYLGGDTAEQIRNHRRRALAGAAR